MPWFLRTCSFFSIFQQQKFICEASFQLLEGVCSYVFLNLFSWNHWLIKKLSNYVQRLKHLGFCCVESHLNIGLLQLLEFKINIWSALCQILVQKYRVLGVFVIVLCKRDWNFTCLLNFALLSYSR